MKKLITYLNLFLLLFVIGGGQLWCAPITIDDVSVTSGDYTIECDVAEGETSPLDQGDYIRLYANNTVTITSSGSAMTQIDIAWTKNSKKAFANVTADCGEYEHPSGAGTGTWTGSASTVVFTVGSSGQIQITEVTITAGAGCSTKLTLTPGSPAPSNGSFTLHQGTASGTTISSGGTVDNCGTGSTRIYVVPSPNSHYHVSSVTSTVGGSPTAGTADGDNYYFDYAKGSAISATIQVAFEADAHASVTLSEAGSTTTDATTYYPGDSYTLPTSSAASCGTKTFVGWSSVEFSETNTKPTSSYYEPGETVTLGASQTFYAVFAQLSSASTATIKATSGDNGDFTGGGTSWSYTNSGTTISFTFSGNYYTSGTPNTFTIGKNSSTGSISITNGVLTQAVVTVSEAGAYYVRSVSSGASVTSIGSGTTQTITFDAGFGTSVTMTGGSGNNTSDQCRITQMVISYKTVSAYGTSCAACTATPDVSSVSMKSDGTFSLSSVAVTCAGATPGSNCSINDYGFYWGASNDPSTNKTQVGTSNPGGAFNGTLSGSFNVNTTYYYRAYATNNGDNTGYSTSGSFVLRQVTFNSQGGSDVAAKIIYDGGKISAPTAPTRDGYNFVRWETDNGAGAPSGTEFDFANTTITAATTLHATWTLKTYTVSYNKGTYGTGENTSDTKYHGSALTLAGITFTRDGYKQDGWSTDAGGSTKNYDLGGSYTTNAAITLYPYWIVQTYSNYRTECLNVYDIVLDKNGGTTDGSAKVVENATSISNITAPVWAGHVVESYHTASSCTNANKVATDEGALSASVTVSATNWTNSGSQWVKDGGATFYAKWALKECVITLDDQGADDGKEGTSSVTATYSQNTNLTSAITKPIKTGSTFKGYYTGEGGTGVQLIDASGNWIASVSGYTDASKNWQLDATSLTLYAVWGYTVTYKNEDDTEITHTDVPTDDNTITLRVQSACPGYSFFGWSTAKITDETTTKPTGATFIGTGSYEVTSDITLYPVYKRVDGYVQKKDTLTYRLNGGVGSYTAFSNISKNSAGQRIHSDAVYAGCTSKTDNYIQINDKNGIVTTTSGGTLEHAIVIFGTKTTSSRYTKIYGQNSAYSTFSSGGLTSPGTLLATASKTTAMNTGRVVVELPGSSTNFESSYPYIAITTTSDGTIYLDSVVLTWGTGTAYYSTHCEIHENVTITYNGNGGTPGCGSATSDDAYGNTQKTVTWDYADGGASAPTLAESQTICASATRSGYVLHEWNTAADGSGRSYTPEATVTKFGGDSTLYAIWDRVYTVKYYDAGTLESEVTQASYGAAVAVPSDPVPCSGWTFVGWTDYGSTLAAEAVKPNIEVDPGDATYTPTQDVNLYAVYSKSIETCENFAAQRSGWYKFYDYSNTYYALTTGSNKFDAGTSGTAEAIYIEYINQLEVYTLHTTSGYIGVTPIKNAMLEVTGYHVSKGNSTPTYYTIAAANDGWKITYAGEVTNYLAFSSAGTCIDFYATATATDGAAYRALKFAKSTITAYYSTADCESTHKITFHNGGGTISAPASTPVGSWSSPELSGLSDCDKVTVWPTASYDGWDFLGWSTEDYSNSGRHTADHADENASTEEPESYLLYGNDLQSYYMNGSDVHMYPVFTRFPDNEPFNTTSGGDFYIYYLKPGSNDGYGGLVRVYAGSYNGNKRYTTTTSCAAATEFTFTKDGDVWHIYDKTAGKYMAGVNGNDDLVHRSDLSGSYDDWTITVYNGNQFNASCQSGTRKISYSTSANDIMDFETGSGPGYLPVYLGSCTERFFSSEPNPTPILELTGEPMVTSSVGQTIRATATMTLNASHISSDFANRIKITGTNLKFASSATASPVTDYYENLVSGGANATIYVYYTPTDTEDGLENIVVTAKAYKTNTPKDLQTTGSVSARHLPSDFVIAAKRGDYWYALPANCTTSGSSTEGVLISVDNDDDPTSATAAPMYTKYGLREVKSARITGNGVGNNLVFTERLTTATANNQKTLYNGSSTNIQVNAQYTSYNSSNPDKYEWVPVTSDFKDYTLSSASAARDLSLGNNGAFGALTKDKAYEGKVRLLPAVFYEPAEMQIVEWKESSVVVMYTGSGTQATTKVHNQSTSSDQSLASAKKDHGVFELSMSTYITSYTNKILTITVKNGSGATVGVKNVIIPAIVTDNSSTSALGVDEATAPQTDVVVLDGVTLSAVATKYTFNNITVYPGGKLVIGAGKQLGMHSLTLRGGSSWGAATYEHKYPQFVVNNTTSGAFSNSAGVINYDYVTTKSQYYTFVLPYASNTKNIKYPVDIYGNIVDGSNKGSFEFQYYDGAARAAGSTGWATLAEDPTEGAALVAGRGYTFLGMPKGKVDAYNGSDSEHSKTRQTYGIHRIPMSIAASAVQSGETNSSPGKSTPISVTLAEKNNASGWVLVGNPFMGDITGLDNDDIQVGELVHTSTVPWDGKWEWDDTNPATGTRFVVIPGPDGTTYESEEVSTAELPAFKNFFVQIKNGSATDLVIPASSRDDAGLAPARYVAQEVKDIRLAVDLVSDTRSDKVDFLINDTYSAAYDDDADFTKMMNGTNFNLYGVYPGDNLSFIAVDKTTAAGSIAIGYQVPASGDYTLQLSDRSYVMADAVEALYVTDHEVSPEATTDLLEGAYEFHVNNAETNNTRFTVSIQLKDEAQTPTDIDDVRRDPDKPTKFIYREKMYILRGGQIYDATGKKVKEINK